VYVYGLVYIGNKNNMDHFVKVFSAFNEDLCKVNSYILDVDQTGHMTMDGVETILHSLKNVGCCEEDTDHFKILSSTTESGDAMTKEGLAKGLKEKNLGTLDM
jgi:hypothetical protein